MDLKRRLEHAAGARSESDQVCSSNEITDERERAGADLAAVSTIFAFMERHPELDLGAPGPLAHFVEQEAGCLVPVVHTCRIGSSLSRAPGTTCSKLLARPPRFAVRTSRRTYE